MLPEHDHLCDQELLLAADGELSPRAAGRVHAHLAACWSCRTRKQDLETAIGEFVHEYGNLDAKIPSADGPRALLKAQLARLAQSKETHPPSSLTWFRLTWFPGTGKVSWSLAAAACALVAIGYFIPRLWNQRPASHLVAFAIPDHSLTPGATVLVDQGEVCRESNTKNRAVPVALQRKVFQEYGIAGADPRAYEVDYLVTPALGGSEDIHNLWPHSYSSTVWNARVKDALEDRLREMVCDGQMDLATAQREIAGNWIEAYKKYFKTDRPLSTRP
jgi:hypothetical protein